MKVLVVCDQGNNRSVTIAGQLKYMGHDVLTAGLATNTPYTLNMLAIWADLVITTEAKQTIPGVEDKTRLWDIGPDHYPRPYNKQLLTITRRLITEHTADLTEEKA